MAGTHPPARLIVMKVHQVPDIASFSDKSLISSVQETPAEAEPVLEVVTGLWLYIIITDVKIPIVYHLHPPHFHPSEVVRPCPNESQLHSVKFPDEQALATAWTTPALVMAYR